MRFRATRSADIAPTRIGRCAHCGKSIPATASSTAYCCAGCEAVATLLGAEGLTGYYTAAGDRVEAVGVTPERRGHAWLDPVVEAAGDVELPTVELDVQGIRCAGCVWLMNELFRRQPGHAAITVNPALGKVRLTWRRGELDLGAWVDNVERFGYQLGPSRKGASRESNSLTWRLGVSVALTMNVMLFSLSFYFGLSPRDGGLFPLFGGLVALLSTGVVVVGGWPFLQAAARGLRRGILHLDLPIALGIVLVYGMSLVQFGRGQAGGLAYFDTLNVFVTLMLLGRFLQQRMLERNRQLLLADDGADGIFVRRLTDAGGVEVVRASVIRAGDRLLTAPGEVVPVAAELAGAPARISTDWINGESTARELDPGAHVPAGSFNAGAGAMNVVARQDFADSTLVELLRHTTQRSGAARHLRFWDRLARGWSIGVLLLAAAALVVWLPHGFGRALDVAVAILVVTCPCAIGLALPLAYEIIHARLRRAGFYVRRDDLLDRLLRVRKVVFDKTGTLTLTRLELAPEANLAALSAAARDVAYNLATRSAHPASVCLSAALARADATYRADAQVVETGGRGLEWVRVDGTWRLGRPSFALTNGRASDDDQPVSAGAEGPVLTRDGVLLARFPMREAARPGAAADLADLRDAGYDLHVLSGDSAARVRRLADALALPDGHAQANLSPAAKATALARLDGADALYLGDGANDALAFEQALCAGTVAIDRPVLPARSDFFIVGETLRPLLEALDAARQLRRVVARTLVGALAYNLFAIATSALGLMSPVRAAVFMPLSSLSILAFTALSLRPRSARRVAAGRLALEAAR